ncbi:hypothetical protein RVR_9099 [Actinacidiphila reveromycinica]|uniref:Uncharacterized protein n=1 Tax=Actinacidiphila reveromycinica TaxID=659352 RepID=A0A7U3UZB5_9ACTN|nr:hypothetical protein [Streptomyces sp. SN-593]BBB01604.1 hypothetical protein RVR_9099 [Streptomyces sp. SN-593]
MTGGTGRDRYDEGGDPVCWLDRVCEECGAFRETSAPDCARCGTPFPGARPGRPAGPPPLPPEDDGPGGGSATPPRTGHEPPGRRAEP